MAIKLSFRWPIRTIPWKWVMVVVAVGGCGYFGWQLWENAIDRPISDDSIRSQQLHLSTKELEKLQGLLEAYHQSPATSETLNGDPFIHTVSSTPSTP